MTVPTGDGAYDLAVLIDETIKWLLKAWNEIRIR